MFTVKGRGFGVIKGSVIFFYLSLIGLLLGFVLYIFSVILEANFLQTFSVALIIVSSLSFLLSLILENMIYKKGDKRSLVPFKGKFDNGFVPLAGSGYSDDRGRKDKVPEKERKKNFIVMLIWAILIGAAIGYVQYKRFSG